MDEREFERMEDMVGKLEEEEAKEVIEAQEHDESERKRKKKKKKKKRKRRESEKEEVEKQQENVEEAPNDSNDGLTILKGEEPEEIKEGEKEELSQQQVQEGQQEKNPEEHEVEEEERVVGMEESRVSEGMLDEEPKESIEEKPQQPISDNETDSSKEENEVEREQGNLDALSTIALRSDYGDDDILNLDEGSIKISKSFNTRSISALSTAVEISSSVDNEEFSPASPGSPKHSALRSPKKTPSKSQARVCAIYGQTRPAKLKLERIRRSDRNPRKTPLAVATTRKILRDREDWDNEEDLIEIDTPTGHCSVSKDGEIHRPFQPHPPGNSKPSRTREQLLPPGRVRSPSRPTYSEVGKLLKSTGSKKRGPTTKVKSTIRAKSASKMMAQKTFGPDLVKESKTYRTMLDNIVGRVKVEEGHEKGIPKDMTAEVNVHKLAEISSLLEAMEVELRQMRQEKKDRARADAACLEKIKSHMSDITQDIMGAIPRHAELCQGVSNLQSVAQADSWLKNAHSLNEAIQTEIAVLHPDTIHSPRSPSLPSTSIRVLESFPLPNITSQAMDIACGVSKTFSQACKEGLDAADKIIRELHKQVKSS